MQRKIPNWPSMPFLRALIPLVVAVLCYEPLIREYVLSTALTCMAFLLFSAKASIPLRFRLRHFISLSCLCLIMCLGYLMAYLHDVRNSPRWIGRSKPEAFTACVSAESRTRKQGYSFILHVISVYRDGKWSPAEGRILAFARETPYAPGDTLCIRVAPSRPSTRNPSYLHYLQRQNIHHSVALRPGNHKLLGSRGREGPLGRIRTSIFTTLDSLFPDRNEKAMAAALLLGYRASLDPELLAAYTNTGVVHVIAVSGMHLALIYGMVSLLLKPLGSRRSRQARTILIMGALWLFALICGGSPSVTRSALMFSFILWADVFRTEHQSANTLAGSAFILVCADPMVVYDIGFQLSYAAVASLMLYSAALTRLLQPDHPLLRHAWSTIATTLAAQVLTTPLTLLHFGQFPLLFLPANILAVPISGIILILLIMACIQHPLGGPEIPAILAGKLIRFLNATIAGLGNTRLTTVRDIQISWYDTLGIYIVILAFTHWIRSKK